MYLPLRQTLGFVISQKSLPFEIDYLRITVFLGSRFFGEFLVFSSSQLPNRMFRFPPFSSFPLPSLDPPPSEVVNGILDTNVYGNKRTYSTLQIHSHEAAVAPAVQEAKSNTVLN